MKKPKTNGFVQRTLLFLNAGIAFCALAYWSQPDATSKVFGSVGILLLGLAANSFWFDVMRLLAQKSLSEQAPSETAPTARRTEDRLADVQAPDFDKFIQELELAKEDGDLEVVLDLYDDHPGEAQSTQKKKLRESIIPWFIQRVMRDLRAGRALLVIGPVTRALALFSEDPSVEPLRSSLPTLRRSLGLCGQCGEPFRGEAPVCPACQLGTSAN